MKVKVLLIAPLLFLLLGSLVSKSQETAVGNLWLESSLYEFTDKPAIIYVKGDVSEIERFLSQYGGRYRHTFSG